MPVFILNDSLHWPDVIVALCTVAIVYATFRQIAIFHRQTSLLQRQQDLMEKTIQLTENDQRPWVGATDIEVISESLDEPGGYRVRVLWKNSGKTPALNLRGEVGLGVEPGIYVMTTRSVGNLFPGASLTSFASIVIESSSARQIEGGVALLYLSGIVLYDDVFGGKDHHTEATFAFSPADRSWRLTSDLYEAT